MSMLATVRLVRVHDRISEQAPRWTINKRTQFLEATAPLTWTGVREYKVGQSSLRILRRWEQVGSPGHLKTLRSLPATQGHPANDEDVSPANSERLTVGYTGDAITDQVVGGYRVPVSRVIIQRPETIEIMTREVDPLTATSLGYNALWWSPRISEIVEEDPNGAVGEWTGPHGPESYDIEHVVDPDCDLVEQLVRDQDFDPDQLGANHYANALRRGRGGQLSELLRVVDSIDIVRPPTKVQVQVPKHIEPKSKTEDAEPKWAVGTDRELSIVSADWDGDAAKASIFRWAGWPDNPDSSKARRAFLVYDTNADELIGSYKLPIARYGDRVEVVDSALRAAASRLPQTDIPREVKERARAVLDGYFEKLEAKKGADDGPQPESKSRDRSSDPRIATSATSHVRVYTPNSQRNPAMTEAVIETLHIGVSRDVEQKLRARGITTFASVPIKVADIDANRLRPALEQLMEIVSDLLADLAASEEAKGESDATLTDAEGAKEAAMMKVKELEGALAEAKAEAEKATDAHDGATKTLTTERDELLAEVAPLRVAAITRARDVAKAAGADDAEVTKAATLADLQRLAVVTKYGDVFGKGKDDVVSGAFVALEAQIKAVAADQKTRDAGRHQFGSDVPAPQLGKVKDEDAADSPPSSADQISAGLAALG